MSADLFSNLSDNKTPPTYKYFDGEKWTNSLSGKFVEIRSPIDNEILGKIPSLTLAEIDKTILKLKEGQKNWQKTAASRLKKLQPTASATISWTPMPQSLMG